MRSKTPSTSTFMPGYSSSTILICVTTSLEREGMFTRSWRRWPGNADQGPHHHLSPKPFLVRFEWLPPVISPVYDLSLPSRIRLTTTDRVNSDLQTKRTQVNPRRPLFRHQHRQPLIGDDDSRLLSPTPSCASARYGSCGIGGIQTSCRLWLACSKTASFMQVRDQLWSGLESKQEVTSEKMNIRTQSVHRQQPPTRKNKG